MFLLYLSQCLRINENVITFICLKLSRNEYLQMGFIRQILFIHLLLEIIMQKSVTKELTKAPAFCLEQCKARTSTKLLAQYATVFVDLCYLNDAIVTLLIYKKYIK